MTTEEIEEQLQKLPPGKLAHLSESLQTMIASEAVLRRDWDSPEEDAAWAHL